MRYQVFKLIDAERSIIKSPFIITNLTDLLEYECEDDPVIEIIEIDGRGFVNSCFYGENEFLYFMAAGHHFWGETEGLLKAITLCEVELNHEVILGTRLNNG